MTETPREGILTEASGLITGDRNKTYGSPTENFENTAAVWNVLLGHKLKEPITATEVGTLMVGLKLARTIAQPKRDNFVDMAGYAACAWECEEAAADDFEMPKPRYWRDIDGWIWREGPPMTHVSSERGVRETSSVGTVEAFLADFADWKPVEIPFSEVPEWAR